VTATVVPTGPVEETAVFLPGTNVTFEESGLLPGTSWNVTLRGVEITTTADQATFFEVSGRWTYGIGNVSGYQLITTGESAWWEHLLIVGSSALVVPVHFTAFRPPLPEYAVTFEEQGLPAGSSWTVGVRNSSAEAATPSAIVLDEASGAYAFRAGAPGGYDVSSPLSFDVGTVALTIVVDFEPGNRVIWNETGLAAGLNWSVLVGGVAYLNSGAWVSGHFLNGSLPFTVIGAEDYVPIPATGSVDLTGNGAVLAIVFTRATFPVTFAVTGLPSGVQYHVRLSNTTQATDLVSDGFQISNGTYTFDVTAPVGYYPNPSHGNVTVQGRPTTIAIAFLADGPGPNPPFLAVALPAASASLSLGLAAAGVFLLLGAIRRRRAKPDARTVPRPTPRPTHRAPTARGLRAMAPRPEGGPSGTGPDLAAGR
jgi:hypothetical protein